MKNVIEKDQCTGCGACWQRCPVHAIEMREDQEGFLYPLINEKICIDCKLCTRICPSVKGPALQEPRHVYAVKHKDDEIRYNSTSGGVFTALSDAVLQAGGIIFGACFDKQMRVHHASASNTNERNRFRGSKYVQSDTLRTFQEARQVLNEGHWVLFTGTPCQISGLKAYLGKEYDKLVTCDLICHGVPSPTVFQEHLEYLKRRYGKSIVDYDFRAQWRGKHIKVQFCDGTEISDHRDILTFTNLFYTHMILRPVCYRCQYAKTDRGSDITIADFWGIEREEPDFNDQVGISLVLINTAKGEKLFNKCGGVIDWRECTLDGCLQPQLQHPPYRPPGRQEFWDDYKKLDFVHICKKYADYGFIASIRKLLYQWKVRLKMKNGG